MEENSLKIPVIKDEAFTVYIEIVDDKIFLHCDVLKKYNKSIKNRLLIAFDVISKAYKKELWMMANRKTNQKTIKFAKLLFGFQYDSSFEDYEFYVRR